MSDGDEPSEPSPGRGNSASSHPGSANPPIAAWDLATVFRLHAKDVARWAQALLGPPWDADDVVQDVFMVVQKKLPAWKPDAKMSTWLFEITRRVALGKRRRQRWLGTRNRPIGEHEEFDADHPSPLQLIERREASRTVYELLDKLPDKYRTTLVLYEIEELAGPEVARLTGTTLENVWVRLHRGRAMFEKKFGARFAAAVRGEEPASDDQGAAAARDPVGRGGGK